MTTQISGSTGIDKVQDGTITDADISNVSASKLTGALPAIDGGSLTGMSTWTGEHFASYAWGNHPNTSTGPVPPSTIFRNTGLLGSTGYFTIPETGYYLVHFNGMRGSSTLYLYMRWWLGSAILAAGLEIHGGNLTYDSASCEDIVYLTAGQVIHFGHANTSTSYGNLHSGYGRIYVVSMWK